MFRFFSSDVDLDEICEPEVKPLIMPTKSGRQETVTFKVSGKKSVGHLVVPLVLVASLQCSLQMTETSSVSVKHVVIACFF